MSKIVLLSSEGTYTVAAEIVAPSNNHLVPPYQGAAKIQHPPPEIGRFVFLNATGTYVAYVASSVAIDGSVGSVVSPSFFSNESRVVEKQVSSVVKPNAVIYTATNGGSAVGFAGEIRSVASPAAAIFVGVPATASVSAVVAPSVEIILGYADGPPTIDIPPSAPSYGALSKNVVEVQVDGTLITQGSISGSLNVLQLKSSGTMFASHMGGSPFVVAIRMEAGGHVSSRQSMSKEAVLISMSGLLVQGVDGNNVIVLVPTEEDADYPNITGEEYIVVNLRTKAHATYRDGERTALAKTASLDFGSHTEKSISDLYLLSRARGPLEVVVNTREEIDRHYPLQFGETGQANIKNKKLALAKGLRGTNWTISLVVPDGSHLEVRGMTLYVTDTERHN